jgi:hypothetical protein
MLPVSRAPGVLPKPGSLRYLPPFGLPPIGLAVPGQLPACPPEPSLSPASWVKETAALAVPVLSDEVVIGFVIGFVPTPAFELCWSGGFVPGRLSDTALRRCLESIRHKP